MSTALRGPGDRYRLSFEALCSARGTFYTHHRSGPATALDDGSHRVMITDLGTVNVVLGENGITVRAVKFTKPGRVLITAVVAAGSGAPDWLPPESTYLIFEGSRGDCAQFKERYIAFDGLLAEEPEADASSPLDRLAVAVGRSVARANAQLAKVRQDGGTALVSSLTIRVGLQEATLAHGRVVVSLARPDAGDTGQFVELTLSPAPSAEPDEAEDLRQGRIGRFDSPRPGT